MAHYIEESEHSLYGLPQRITFGQKLNWVDVAGRLGLCSGAFRKVYGSQQRRGTCTNVFVRGSGSGRNHDLGSCCKTLEVLLGTNTQNTYNSGYVIITSLI